MLRSKRLAVFGIVGALVLLLGGAGVVYAQGPQPPVGNQPFGGREAFGGGDMFGPRRFDGSFADGGPFQRLVGITAEVTGLSEDEVLAALKDGQTFAEIAESEGVDPQEIVDAAIDAAETRLQEAVDDGRLTEEQMDQILERLAEDLPERLEQPWQAGPAGGILGRFGEGFWTMYDAVAEALGLTPEDLFTELHGGKTVVEVAEEQDVEMAAIREALEESRVEIRRQAIEQAVEDGRLSREQADWMLEGLEQGFVPGGRGFGQGPGSRQRRGGCGGRMGW